MDKNQKLPHLNLVTKRNGWQGWALHCTAPLTVGEGLSRDVEKGVEITGLNKSQFVIQAIQRYVDEIVAQDRVEFALKICDELINPDCPMDNNIWQEVKIIRMALTGCPTKTNTEFTGELSAEYKARYGDE